MTNRLIQNNGKVSFGQLGNRVSAINVEQFRLRKPRGGLAPKWRHWLGYKQFQYFGIASNQLMFGCAIAHLRHSAIAFIYLFQPQRGMLLEITKRIPVGLGVSLTNTTTSGCSHFRSGNLHISIHHHGPRKRLIVNQGKTLQVDAWFDESELQPLGQCSRIGRTGWVYARKVAGVRCHGSINHGSDHYDLNQLAAYAHHDFSAGYMRRETFWNWACLTGQNDRGDHIGLNLSCGVNETSVSENALWLNGRLHHLALCHFEYDGGNPDKPWQIYSEDGSISLTFTPHGAHQQRLNLLLVASDFKQFFGQFNGQICLADNTAVVVDGLWGFVEDQYAKW